MARICDLPEALLPLIISRVSLRSRGFNHALVCRAWRDASWQVQASFHCTTRTWTSSEEEIVQEMSQFPELRVAQIKGGFEVSDAFIESVSQLCPRLEVLEISMPVEFIEASFQQLASFCPRLRSLRFSSWGELRSAVPLLGALAPLSSLTSLRALHLQCDQSQSIWWLSSMTTLVQLKLHTWENSFSECVWAIRNLRVLHLQSKYGKALSPRIASLSRLTSLRLELEQLAELPPAIGGLSSLKILHVTSHRMQSIPSFLSRLCTLEHLHVEGNAVRAVEVEVGAWPLLRELTLVCPRLTAVSSIALRAPPTSKIFLRVAIDALPDLYPSPRFASQHSDALSLVSSSDPDYLGKLTLQSTGTRTQCPAPSSAAACEALSLIELVMSSRSTAVCLPLGLFSALRSLTLGRSKHITGLPDSLGSLLCLTSLILEDLPKLCTLPESLGSLTQLAKFCIRECNQIGQIPESIGALTSLQEVIWNGVQDLRCLPDSMGALQGLRKFTLGFSGVETLPEGWSALQCLEELHLFSNSRMTQVPAVVGTMSTLRVMVLNRQHGDIFSFTGELTGLVLLKKLDISSCETVMRLPESLGQLHMLRALSLTFLPKLEELSESVGELSSLRFLHLKRLPVLRGLPDTITRLTELRVLDVSDCGSLSSVPSLASSLRKLTPTSMECSRKVEREAIRRAERKERLASLRKRKRS